MRRIVIILIVLFALPAYSTDIEVTIHVDGNYKPYSYGENGQAKGMYIDVLRTAFSRMEGFKVQLNPVPWKRGKRIMEMGEGFGLTPAFFHGHDWPYLYPYSLSFYTETIITVCQAPLLDSPRPNWPQDYLGLHVGNVAGFDGWGGEEFRLLVAQKKILYEEAKGSQENILKLAYGRLDCILMEEQAFDYELRKLKASGKYDEGKQIKLKKGAVVGQDPVYIGYSKPAMKKGQYSYQLEFMQAFDSEIYKMIKSGEVQKIMAAYHD